MRSRRPTSDGRLRVSVSARNAAGSRSRTSVPTAKVEARPPPGPGGQVTLPSGVVSVPIENVSLPTRLVIDQVRTTPQSATQLDGWVTLRTRPRAPRPGLVFPLRRGLNVQFYVQARKAGERVLFGVTGTRLSQVHTAR